MFTDIDLTNYKGVLLDLDDTIYLYDSCHQVGKKAMLDLLCDSFSIPLEEANLHYRAAREKVHMNLDGHAASHSRLLYAKYMIEEIADDFQAQLALDLEEAYWSVFLSIMEIHPKALLFLDLCILVHIGYFGVVVCVVLL